MILGQVLYYLYRDLLLPQVIVKKKNAAHLKVNCTMTASGGFLH